jgi:hypothetical protein
MNLRAPVILVSSLKYFPEGDLSCGNMLKTIMEKISKDFGVQRFPFTEICYKTENAVS